MQLFLRPTVIAGERLENDYVVMFEGRRVGRIRQAHERVGFASGWDWSINPPLPIPSWGTGSAESLERAKEQFKAAWERFYAEMSKDDIAYWHRQIERE